MTTETREMTPEEEARKLIDDLLGAAGWQVQDYKQLNLRAGLGVAVREFPLKTGSADYMLFVDRKAAGVIEAKRGGTTLGGVDWQSEKYTKGLPDDLPHYQKPLPFAYESTGKETFFRDLRDPEPCSRRVFAFFEPETLKDYLSQEDTLRLYSLGVMLFGLLTGEYPHDLSGSCHQVLRRMAEEPIKRPRKVNPKLDKDTESLLLKALDNNPDRRYASVGEMVRDIDNYLRDGDHKSFPVVLDKRCSAKKTRVRHDNFSGGIRPFRARPYR